MTKPTSRTVPAWLYPLLVAAVTSAAAASCLGDRSPLQLLLRLEKAYQSVPWASIDAVALAASATGNAALSCPGVDKAPPQVAAGLPAAVYFRGCYSVYPRRLFAAPPGTVINEAKDFVPLQWRPDKPFIANHDITGLIELTVTPEGAPHISVMEVSAHSNSSPSTRDVP